MGRHFFIVHFVITWGWENQPCLRIHFIGNSTDTLLLTNIFILAIPWSPVAAYLPKCDWAQYFKYFEIDYIPAITASLCLTAAY